ncbi:hypothetical protein H9623_10805 [Oerskovia sp. Sa1BUA8]|uniref:Uncharacterized protein n=1 Tax=Oerskovia douganii TaxID=2762210 RepID=A0A9D5U927_9CELL|nr:hypothetical protein [Oerskovia douganii]MBE7700789.1 hypothetical protein [Oerskovia douganii]
MTHHQDAPAPPSTSGSDHVFLVRHRHRQTSGHVDDKMIGVFASAASAERAVERLREQPGFRDTPTDFTVHALPVGAVLEHGIVMVE